MTLISKAITPGYKFVYTTATSGARSTTIADFFQKNIEKNAPKISKQIYKEAKNNFPSVAKQIENMFAGLNLKIKSRLKDVDSMLPKVLRESKGISAEGNIMAHNIIEGAGYKELVGDSIGYRIFLPLGQKNEASVIAKILDRLKLSHKLAEVENYHGKNIQPYINGVEKKALANTMYKNTKGTESNLMFCDKKRDAGYTRVNTGSIINDIRVEGQLGGIHTIKIGEVEHPLYDIRTGKGLNFNKILPKNRTLANEIYKTYVSFCKKPEHKLYEKYLTSCWQTARKAERKGLEEVIYPRLPEDVPQVLSVENLIKIHER